MLYIVFAYMKPARAGLDINISTLIGVRVTMHFPKAAYPFDSLRTPADDTKPGDRLFYGDVHFEMHILVFGVYVETALPLPRPEATVAAVWSNFHIMTKNMSSSWVQSVYDKFLNRVNTSPYDC